MNYLFVIAMKKEAEKIIEHYALKKVNDNYYKQNNIELIITDVSRNGITNTLVNMLYKYNLDYKNYVMINVGMVGSNNLSVGQIISVSQSFGYHFNLTPFGDPLYHSLNSPFKLNEIKGIKQVKCFTSDGFVTKTSIKEDAVFDMELNAIVNFPFKKHYSIKIISDSLNDNEYNNFNYDDKIKEILKITDGIIQDK